MSEGQATFGNSDDRAAATSLGLSGSGSGLETAKLADDRLRSLAPHDGGLPAGHRRLL